jgi:hypothetical protein
MGEEKEKQNLWSTLLTESSKRFKAPEATCIFLGDTDVGKNTLISKIGGSVFESEVTGRIIKDIISYAFIDVDDGFLDSESISRINLWSINNKTFEGCIENVIKPTKAERVCYSHTDYLLLVDRIVSLDLRCCYYSLSQTLSLILQVTLSPTLSPYH